MTTRSANSAIGASGSRLTATIVLGGLHPDLVLDRAGDAEREVELRLDDLAGLADLLGVRDPARVDGRARRADRAAERLRELLDELEAVRAADAAAARDDDPGLLDRERRRPASSTRSTILTCGQRQLAVGASPVSTVAGGRRRLGGHDVRADRDDPLLAR